MKSKNADPPKLFLRFFRWYCHPNLLKYIEGDLIELYQERREEKGKRKADIQFILDVLLLFRPGIINLGTPHQSLNTYAMYKNYFKVGLRNLLKNRGYAFINIGGLAVGMAISILIALWIFDELSFNQYHQHYGSIARVVIGGSNNSGPFVIKNTSPPMGNEIRTLYGTEFKHVIMASSPNRNILLAGENKVLKTGYYAEPGIAEMLTLKMLMGAHSGLQNKESIFLSESTAKALFGNTDPLNKVIRMVDSKQDVVVAGVYEDIPAGSDFSNMNFIATWELYVSSNQWIRQDDWRQSGFRTYVELADHIDMQSASDKIKDIQLHHVSEEDAIFKFRVFLHPMSRWHLYSNLEQGGGQITFVWIYGSIGLFVLLLACINFMNLSTAQSEKRAKEVGIRKSIGSVRSQLISQFFSESLMVTFFSFMVALLLAQLALPFFNEVADKKMSIPVSNVFFWLLGIGFCVLTGMLAGSYPAFYLSSFQPVKVLKGTFKAGRFAAIPRKVLVVAQFTISITLIIGVIIIFQQLQFGKDRPVGYSRDGLIWVETQTGNIHQHIDAVRDKLKKSGAVTEIAESLNPMTDVSFVLGGYDWTGTGSDPQAGFPTVWVAPEFGKTVGWQFIAGRDFSRDYASDTAAMVLNETAAKFMNLEDPVGKTVKLTLYDKTTAFTVIGVIKDMLMESPFYPVRKTVYMIDNTAHNFVNIRINPEISTTEALQTIESVFKKYDPDSPFAYKFVDEEYAHKFSEEERTAKLASLFAGIAIFISCLGIFGLASFVAEQRTKEIGIRKVLGATVTQLWRMLSRDFVKLVMISCFVAIPLAWYIMNTWLQDFDYRISLSWSVFAIAGLGALLLTLLTVSYQAIKAALANPVKSLRSE